MQKHAYRYSYISFGLYIFYTLYPIINIKSGVYFMSNNTTYEDLVGFADRLKAERLKMHLTQKQVSEQLGFSLNYINQLENSKRSPSLNSLTALADYFNVTTDYLLKGQSTATDDELSHIINTYSPEQRNALATALKLLSPKYNSK